MVRLNFSITLAYQVLDGFGDFILNVCAAQNARQSVRNETLWISQDIPVDTFMRQDDCSRFVRFRAHQGNLDIHYHGLVDITHYLTDPAELREMAVAELSLDACAYIYPSRYCQSDLLRTLANLEFGHLVPGYYRVAAIERWVNSRTRFVVGSSGSSTSALETLADGAGVCRDFAHLMIALCRALNIPARYVSGIDYGADPSLGPTDFHAYVEVMLSGRWYLFDPSGISPPMGLVRLGTGRDAADVSFATMFGNVSSCAPRIEINAESSLIEGVVVPSHIERAISSFGGSDSAFRRL